MRALLITCLLLSFMIVVACDDGTDDDDDDDGSHIILKITEPANGSTVTTGTIMIRGQAPANAEIKRDVSFGFDDSIHADDAGNWQFEVDLDLGANEFEFFLEDDDDVRVKYKVTYDPSVAETTAGDETEAPTSPTSEPTDAEPAAPEFISGLAAIDVTGNLEERGFECDGPHQLQTLLEWVCESTSLSGAYIYVSVLGAGPTQIRSIDATHSDLSGDLSAASDFLGFLATVPYDDASPEAARSWVQTNISGDADTTFGSARFSLYGPDTAKILEVVAVGAQ